MGNDKRILYVLVVALLGANVILGALFLNTSSKMRSLERQATSMENTIDDTITQLEAAKGVASADVEAAYAATDEGEQDVAGETAGDAQKPTGTEEQSVDAQTEFDDLRPQLTDAIANAKSQVGGDWAVYVEDLNTGGNLSLENKKMKAASLIKLYIMGAIYEDYDTVAAANSNVDNLLNSMITVSDNEAANELVRALGGGDEAQGINKVNSFCTNYNYDDTSMGRLLLADSTSGDNYTSVEDCGKLLYHVYSGKFKRSEEMQELLRGQTLKSKIPSGVPEGVVTANKTGELDDVQNDVAIVYGEKTPYILCVMSEGISGADASVSIISTLSNAVYGYTNQTD